MTESDSWATEIGAITLFADDLQAMKRFYLDVFGLPVVFEDANSAVFDVGGTLINLLTMSATHELVAPATPGSSGAEPRSVLTIRVADVDAVAADVVAKGAVLLNGPMDRPWGIRTASFRDPSGHVWEIAT